VRRGRRNANAPKKNPTKSVDPQNRTEHGSEPAKHEPALSPQPALPAKSPEPPKAEKKTYRARQECRDKIKLTFETFTFFAVVGYATIAALQLGSMLKANELGRQGLVQAQQLFTITQLPYVNLGNPDGLLAEFLDKFHESRPVIAMHFFNAGHSTAFDFGITPREDSKLHLRRYLTPKGMILKLEDCHDVAISGQGNHVEYLTNEAVASAQDVVAIQTGGKKLQIGGSFEYCDEFGDYRCEMFSLQYRSGNINAFDYGRFGMSALDCNGVDAMTEPATQEIFDLYTQVMPSGVLTPLLRCRQPGEPPNSTAIVRPTVCN